MPHDVLESVLEAVPRTAQSGRPGPFARWRFDGRSFAVVTATAVVVVAVLVGPLAIDRARSLWMAIGGGGETRVWDPVTDFRRAPNQRNPSPDRYGKPDVWSYLRSRTSAHEPTAYSLLPSFSNYTWNELDLVNLFVGVDAKHGSIHLHPWGGGPDRRNAILGWTSPVTGRISIDGAVGRAQPACSVSTGNIFFSIDHGSTSLKTISLLLGQSAEFNLTTTVATGESLYFIVDAGGDANCDLTYLRLKIIDE